ncbi:hypothetical protein [Actinorugispora endophytica]|uniref:Uncharacterized protein n=1 Tax=Actinorugispora endophytica TaxID=1605990 RepID=A0A4R6V7W1_9ACTN|nr:hypothetical protein [Actinorugispora endophytica]TDQ55206.1 hypothetical protein EV190_101531 [Actinorugispora endophytica]
MWDVLSALIPPTVVAAVFCAIVYTVLRKEMAPRTSDGRLLKEAEAGDVQTASRPDTNASADGGAKNAPGSSTEVPDGREEPGGR